MSVQVPKGYKQTEVGVIPEDWELSALEKLTDPNRPISYGIVQTGPNVLNGIKCLRVVDIDNGKIKKENLITTTKEISDSYKRTILKDGDLVIPLRGKVGEVGLIEGDLEGSNLTRGVGLIALRKDFDSLFFKQNIASIESRRRLEQSMNGSALQEIPIATLRAFKIAYPKEIVEQQAIAESLSDADALIESLEQLIAKKRQIKQGAMQELLTGKRRLPGFSGVWAEIRLGEVAEFFKGKGLPKSHIIPDGSDACIHYGELFTHYPEIVKEIFSRTNEKKDAFRSLANDVLMPTSDVTPRGLAKASCVCIDGVILGGDILVIRPKKNELNGSFLSYLIREKEDLVLNLVTGSTVFHLYGSDMKRFIFRMPPIAEQNEIVSVLASMSAEIAALENRLIKARQIKQAMMQELLTGHIRLL